MPQETLQIPGLRGVDNFPSISGPGNETVASESGKMGRKGVLPDIQAGGELSCWHPVRRGEQLFHGAQARDVAQCGKTLSKKYLIHSSRIADKRDKHVTPL
jgi:hypothetical protein